MKMKHSPFTLAGVIALSSFAAAGVAHAAGSENHVTASLERIDDCFDPAAEFAILLDVELSGGGVTAVHMASAAGLDIDLENEGDGAWFGETAFADLTALANQTNGLWTITITGGPDASTSTFTLNVADVDLQDFYAPPANVLPASGTIAPNVTFTWDDPTTGHAPPDALLVDTDYQDENLATSETSWTPPLTLTPGGNSFAVAYLYAADAGTAGPLVVTEGAIDWNDPPLAAFGSETIRCYQVQELGEPASLVVALERIDDPGVGPFVAYIDAELPGLDPSSVEVRTPGLVIPLTREDVDLWEAELSFADVAALIDALDGTWFIEVFGDDPSLSEFDLDLTALADGDFFPTPTDVLPERGATGVPADAVVSWSDPTGTDTADLLFVEADDQEASTFAGTLDIADESWTPPLALDPGYTEVFIGYYRADDAGLASPIIAEGAIVWGTHAFAPPGYPEGPPLLAFGSETSSFFEVGGADCPADVSGDGVVGFADVLAILAAWGPCEGCAQDVNGDGLVGFADVLMVLGGWGPCE